MALQRFKNVSAVAARQQNGLEEEGAKRQELALVNASQILAASIGAGGGVGFGGDTGRQSGSRC